MKISIPSTHDVVNYFYQDSLLQGIWEGQYKVTLFKIEIIKNSAFDYLKVFPKFYALAHLAVSLPSLLDKEAVLDVDLDEEPLFFKNPFLEEGTFVIVEEILFRGIAQNGLAFLQNKINTYAPETLKDTRVFKWLVFPSARILVISALFSLVHWQEPAPFGIYGKISRTILCMVYPTETLLYEKYGSLFASVTSHLIHDNLMHIVGEIHDRFTW